MLIFFKAVLLILSVFITLPIVFFILVGLLGKYFSLTIDSNCWLAKTNIKFIKYVVHKFI